MSPLEAGTSLPATSISLHTSAITQTTAVSSLGGVRGDADRHLGLARLPPPPGHSYRRQRPHLWLLAITGYHEATGSHLENDGKAVSRAVASAVCCCDLDTATLMARVPASPTANLKPAMHLKVAHGGSRKGGEGPEEKVARPSLAGSGAASATASPRGQRETLGRGGVTVGRSGRSGVRGGRRATSDCSETAVEGARRNHRMDRLPRGDLQRLGSERATTCVFNSLWRVPARAHADGP